MAVRVALHPELEFYMLIEPLRVHEQFWKCLAVKLTSSLPPDNQNPLKYLQDVYMLSRGHIKPELLKELQSYSVDPEIDDHLRTHLQKLLCWYSNILPQKK